MSASALARERLGTRPRRHRRLRTRSRERYRSLFLSLVAFGQMAVIGGLAFTSGFLGCAALRALGWPTALAGALALLGAPLALSWYWTRGHLWRKTPQRLPA